MEIGYDLSQIFPDQPIQKLSKSDLMRLNPRKYWAVEKAINQMGERSATAQGLKRVLTTYQKIVDNEDDQRLYILWNPHPTRENTSQILGILKVGPKKLYLLDTAGKKQYEEKPLCILDFYVHEDVQRQGNGHRLYDYMLSTEDVNPSSAAIDRPSAPFLQFLEKFYKLREPVWQNTNFVVFPQFFENKTTTTKEENDGFRRTAKSEKLSNYPAQNSPRTPRSTSRSDSAAGIIHGTTAMPERRVAEPDTPMGRKNTRDFGHQNTYSFEEHPASKATTQGFCRRDRFGFFASEVRFSRIILSLFRYQEMTPLKTLSLDYEMWIKDERFYSTEPWLNGNEDVMEQRKEDEHAVRKLIGDPADIDLNDIGKNDEDVDLPSFLPLDAKKSEISDFVDKIYEEQRRQCELGIPFRSTQTETKKNYKQKGYKCKKGEKRNGQPRKKRELVARAHVSYFVVSGLALLNARGPILSRDIYRFAKYYFPGCVTSSHWKNSIRNILSTQDFFVKIESQQEHNNSATWTWNRDHLPKLEAAIEDVEKTLKQPEFFGMSDPSQWPAIKAGIAGHPDKDFPIDIDEKSRNISSPTPSMPSEDDPMSPRLEESGLVAKKGKRKSPSPPPVLELPIKAMRPLMNPQQLAQYHYYQQQQQQQQYHQYLQACYHYRSQMQIQDEINGCQLPPNKKTFFDGDIDEMVKMYLVEPFAEKMKVGQDDLVTPSSQVFETCQTRPQVSYMPYGARTDPMIYESL